MGFGAGRFRRNHFVFLHWHGESVGAVKRGKANAEKSAVAEALGSHSVELSASDLDECDLKAVIDKVKKALAHNDSQSIIQLNILTLTRRQRTD